MSEFLGACVLMLSLAVLVIALVGVMVILSHVMHAGAIYGCKYAKRVFGPAYHKPIVISKRKDGSTYSTAESELVYEISTGGTPAENICLWKFGEHTLFSLENDSASTFVMLSKASAYALLRKYRPYDNFKEVRKKYFDDKTEEQILAKN